MQHLIIIGSGIVGLAHALAAIERGWRVTVFEKDGKPLGATTRNFGTIWPVGQPAGALRQRALRSAARWRELSQLARFSCQQNGSLHVVYNDDAMKVLLEFDALEDNDPSTHSILSPEDIARVAPHVRQDNLRGGLLSTTELTIIPNKATMALIKWLESSGVTFHFQTPVVQVEPDRIRTSSGDRVSFDRLVICSGDEVRLLFPRELQQANVIRCKLQMMKSAPQPEAWHLKPIVASELTLRHYESFQSCPTLPDLQRRLAETWKTHEEWGIHVLAVQRPSGELILGDSHEYAMDFSPLHKESIDRLILDYLDTFLEVGNPQIVDRWNGYYLKTTHGSPEVILEPQEHVQIVTGLGGAGLTLAFGLAEEVVSAWEQGDNEPVRKTLLPN